MSTPSSPLPLADHGIILPPVESTLLRVERDPDAILDEAHRAAQAIKKVIDSRSKPLIINGEKYLFYEDWLTVGRFFGIVPRTISTKVVKATEHVRGYVARAEAVEVKSQLVVSAAEAMCLTDEPTWTNRPKYEWNEQQKKSVKVQKPVPRAQMFSMAQTRACAKAVANCTRWVVVLAGYQATPAEEMDEFNQEQATAVCAGCGLDLYDAKEIAESRARFGTATCKVCVKKIDQRKASQSVEARRAEYSQQAGD